MITEDYVSFETAKLLKEKGFDVETRGYYPVKGDATGRLFANSSSEYNHNHSQVQISAPTLQMAMKWLEEIHHILVVPDYIYEFTDTSWVYKIYRLGENGKPERYVIKGTSYDKDNTPTEHVVGYRDYMISDHDYATKGEAEEEGIKYCLENLILICKRKI